MTSESEIIQSHRKPGETDDPGRPIPATRIVLRSRVAWSTATVEQIEDVLDAASSWSSQSTPESSPSRWITLPLVEQGREVDARVKIAAIDYYHQAGE